MVKIKSKNENGKFIEIEVTEQFAQEYNHLEIEIQRDDWVYEKHNTPLSGFEYEDAKYFTDKHSNIESSYIADESVREYFSILSAREQYIVTKIAFEGYVRTELAETEGISETAIRKIFNRAIEKMRDYITNSDS